MVLTMDMKKMMKQMQKAQQAAQEVQDKLEQMSVTSATGGLVVVTMNGQGAIQSVKIDPKVVDPSDVEALEDLLVVAIRDAHQKATQLQQEETQKSMGFLGGMF